jgi:LysM domain
VRSKAILCALIALPLAAGRLQAQQAATSDSGLRTGPATVAPHWSKYKYPDTIPEGATYYIVQRGDTLWDLAGRYLGNNFLWPQIWDLNRYITDAHWIYPGDPLLMPKVSLVSERAGAGEEEGLPPEAPEGEGAGTALYPVSEEVTMQCAHYVVSDREDESLKVIGSENGSAKLAFADREILYLNKGSNAGVKPGDVFSIHHTAYPVKHPVSGKTIGRKVETTGWLRVLLVEENTSTVVVEQACKDIHAGDYLKAFEKVNVPLVLRRPPPDRLTPPSGKAQGYVVDIADDVMVAGTGQIVSIDLGSEAGIAPGNMLTVYRIMYPSVPTTRNVLGELAVLTVRDRTATAKVMYSNDAIMNGDPVELR